jgi:hypothetical protein
MHAMKHIIPVRNMINFQQTAPDMRADRCSSSLTEWSQPRFKATGATGDIMSKAYNNVPVSVVFNKQSKLSAHGSKKFENSVERNSKSGLLKS